MRSILTQPRLWSRLPSGHVVHSGVGEGEGAVSAVAPEAEGRAVVELEGVACMMMRESEFFLGALSNGFKETATRVINTMPRSRVSYDCSVRRG
jgi:hypothetical protein